MAGYRLGRKRIGTWAHAIMHGYVFLPLPLLSVPGVNLTLNLKFEREE
jgi:hypothetical protein